MPLLDLDISINDSVLPENVAAFLDEADSRVNEFVSNQPICLSGFVPCNSITVYHTLRAITQANLAAGTTFCEWGSGFGVATSLAAMLGFTGCGIEIRQDLVEASQRLASDFGLPVEFVHGSFVPAGAEACVEEAYADNSSEFLWIVTDADDAYQELGLDIDEFDVVFAYPWPGEDSLVANLFEKCAAEQALLLTFDQFNSVRLRRKVGSLAGDFSEATPTTG